MVEIRVTVADDANVHGLMQRLGAAWIDEVDARGVQLTIGEHSYRLEAAARPAAAR